ncbi:MAG: T9SS type A sorting domain-containing protein [Bacteroidia bacterium]
MKTLRKLITFLILNSSFCVYSVAQIVYTNVLPDDSIFCPGCPSYPCSSMCDPDINIDLNNDGFNDFSTNISIGWNNIFDCTGSPGVDWYHGIYSTPLVSNAIASTGASYIQEFNFSDTIGSQLSWVQFSPLLIKSFHYQASICSLYVAGNWTGTGFIGLKLNVGNQQYYGWARVYADPGNAFYLSSLFILYDYAYNSVPNQFILAGDTGNGPAGLIENSISSNFSVYSSNKKIIIQLNNTDFDFGNIDIYNIIGQKIKKINITNKITQIVMNENKGIYVVVVQTNNVIKIKKISLQ